MKNLLDHFSGFGESIAFIEDERRISYNEFINDVVNTENEITRQLYSNHRLIVWNYKCTYQNIVLFFAFANAKCILVPGNISERLFLHDEQSVINAFNSEVIVFGNISNNLTKELKLRDASGIIISTSGTGNIPKDILLDLDLLSDKYLKLKTKFTSILSFSLEHISGIETLLSILSPGGTMILEKDRSPVKISNSIKKHNIDLLACTPSFLIQLYLKDLLAPNLNSLRFINCGGESLSVYWYEKIHEKIPHVEIRQAFGTTESTNIRTYNHPFKKNHFKPGINGIDYKVVDRILFLKNKNYMLGNWNEDNFNMVQWIETSDIVEEDREGFIEIIGRKEHMISVGGKKADPREIEQRILELSYVTYCKVYAEANILLGQTIVADVILENEISEVKTKIRQYCLEFLEEYKVPSRIRILQELPLSNRMKYSN